MSTPDEALQKYIGDLGGVESNAWHDVPVDQVFKDGFAAGRQSVIDEANAQEPAGVAYQRFEQGNADPYEHTICKFKAALVPAGTKLYARPIPAQQSPAVAVPDAVSVLDKAAEGIENQIANAGLRNDLYDAGYLRAIKRELIKLRDSLPSPSPRITEQDAFNVIDDFLLYCREEKDGEICATFFDEWLESEGRALPTKLSEANHAR